MPRALCQPETREKKRGTRDSKLACRFQNFCQPCLRLFLHGERRACLPAPPRSSPMGIQGLLPVLKPIVSEDHIKMFKGKTVKTLAAPRPQERSRSLEAAHSLRPLARRWPWMRRAGCTRARLPARTSWAWGFQQICISSSACRASR